MQKPHAGKCLRLFEIGRSGEVFTLNSVLLWQQRSATIFGKKLLRMEDHMPERETLERAHKDAAEGKSASTQAGEFVREEIHHVREGKHGARSPQQAIAIGLSKARRAGVKLSPPKGPSSIRKKAAQDVKAGEKSHRKTPRTQISQRL